MPDEECGKHEEVSAEQRSPAFEPGLKGLAQLGVVTFTRGILAPFVHLRVENAPDLARRSPVILAPNHTSYLDPPLLQIAVVHHITFLMTETIYSLPVARAFFRFWDAIPVPENGSSVGAIKGALRAIRRRRPVCIFPEGRISDDGCLNEGRPGVVTLMLRAGVPVIPVALLGPHRIFPRGARMIRPGRVIVRFGEPIAPPHGADRETVRAFARTIMDAIHALGAPRRGEDTGHP